MELLQCALCWVARVAMIVAGVVRMGAAVCFLDFWWNLNVLWMYERFESNTLNSLDEQFLRCTVQQLIQQFSRCQKVSEFRLPIYSYCKWIQWLMRLVNCSKCIFFIIFFLWDFEVDFPFFEKKKRVFFQ